MARVEPYVKVKEIIRDNPDLLAVDGQVNIGCVIVAPVGPRLAYIDGPASFLKNYTVDGVTIPRDADITFINAYYLSFSSGLVVARSMNSDATGGAILYLGDDGITGEATNIYFKDGVQLKKKLSISINGIQNPNEPAQVAEEPTEAPTEGATEEPTEAPTEGATEAPTESNKVGGWAFIINDTLYYGGDYDSVLKGLSEKDGINSEIDFATYEAVKCDDLYTEDSASYSQVCLDYIASDINRQDSYVAVSTASGITIYMDEFSSVTTNQVDYINDEGQSAVGTITPLTCTATQGTAEDVDPESGDALLTIRCKMPQDSSDEGNLYTVAFSKPRYGEGGKLLFDLTITVKNQDPQTYVVSFDKEAVDSSGLNCYIEMLNTYDDIPVEFTVNEDAELSNIDKDTIKNFGQISFGHAFLSTAKSKEVAYMKDALNSLEDQESYRISYLAPVGMTNVAFLKAYTSLGTRKRWFAPVDVPWDRTNVSSIKSFGDNIDDSYTVYVVGPFDKNSGLTGWVNYIAATTLYWERVMINRAANSEFAPVFDQRTGLLNYTNPVKLLKKSNREKLISLSKPINWIIYDMNTGAYYMNDNWNHYSKSENVVGEECNARMVHRISNDLEELYKQFKARHNTVQTRRSVHNVTDLYFQQNIMNQEFKPAEYRIVCDETNNTDEIIRSRKLAIKVQVRLYNSIKYIDVINEVYSVGGEPFVE